MSTVVRDAKERDGAWRSKFQLEVAALRGNAQAQQERDRLLPSLSPTQQAEATQQVGKLKPVVPANAAVPPAKAWSPPSYSASGCDVRGGCKRLAGTDDSLALVPPVRDSGRAIVADWRRSHAT
jgi:hypothetical protein